MIVRQQDTRLESLHVVTGRLTEVSKEIGDALDRSSQFFIFTFMFFTYLTVLPRQIDQANKDMEQNQKKVGILTKTVDKLSKSQSF